MVESSMVFLGLLVFGALAYAAYYGMKAEEEQEKKRQLAIKRRLNAAKIGLLDGRHDEFLITSQVALLDTRRSDGRDVLKIIDEKGTLYCDLKGVHYVGLNRRQSWDWNKMVEVRSKYGSTTTLRIVVSNRQKISGISLRVSYPIFVQILEFLNWGRNQSFPSKKTSKSPGSSPTSKTNITYNIVQNVQDSVIQGNFELNQSDAQTK
jgi:hypothetical protein